MISTNTLRIAHELILLAAIPVRSRAALGPDYQGDAPEVLATLEDAAAEIKAERARREAVAVVREGAAVVGVAA